MAVHGDPQAGRSELKRDYASVLETISAFDGVLQLLPKSSPDLTALTRDAHAARVGTAIVPNGAREPRFDAGV